MQPPDLSETPDSWTQAMYRDAISYRMGGNHWPMRRVVLGFWIWVAVVVCIIAVTECLKDRWAGDGFISENRRLEAEAIARHDSLKIVLKWGRK